MLAPLSFFHVASLRGSVKIKAYSNIVLAIAAVPSGKTVFTLVCHLTGQLKALNSQNIQ